MLSEASTCVAVMTTPIPRCLGVALTEMDAAVRELQADLRALPSNLAEEHTDASLLIEESARIKGSLSVFVTCNTIYMVGYRIASRMVVQDAEF